MGALKSQQLLHNQYTDLKIEKILNLKCYISTLVICWYTENQAWEMLDSQHQLHKHSCKQHVF